jgi:hypothetical protein
MSEPDNCAPSNFFLKISRLSFDCFCFCFCCRAFSSSSCPALRPRAVFLCLPLSGLLGMSDAQRKDVESVLAVLPDMDVEVRFK